MNHIFYMKRCIELATRAGDRGDSPVGSLIVLNDRVIGEGIEGGKTFNDITFHAEIEAIRQASRFLRTIDLSGCILYTTHEPCIMCSYVIRHSKINTVVLGVKTEDTGGLSSAYPLLTDVSIKKWGAPPGIIAGILEKECRDLNSGCLLFNNLGHRTRSKRLRERGQS
jgi:tRNA(adenine34) deaminase